MLQAAGTGSIRGNVPHRIAHQGGERHEEEVTTPEVGSGGSILIRQSCLRLYFQLYTTRVQRRVAV